MQLIKKEIAWLRENYKPYSYEWYDSNHARTNKIFNREYSKKMRALDEKEYRKKIGASEIDAKGKAFGEYILTHYGAHSVPELGFDRAKRVYAEFESVYLK